MANIDPLNSGRVIIRTGKAASARIMPKSDGDTTDHLEVTVNLEVTTAKDLERMLSQLNIEYVPIDELKKAAGENGKFENRELAGLDGTLEEAVDSHCIEIYKDLSKSGIQWDAYLMGALSLEKANDPHYISTLKGLKSSGIEVNGQLIEHLTLQKSRDPHYIGILKDLNKTGIKIVGSLIGALTWDKAGDAHYIETLKDLKVSGIELDGKHIEHLTLGKAGNPNYITTLKGLKRSGIEVNGQLIYYFTQEQARDPHYFKILMGLKDSGIIIDGSLIGALTLEKSRDPHYLGILMGLKDSGIKIDGGLIRSLTEELAGDAHYIEALKDLQKSGIAIDGLIVYHFTQEQSRDPHYIKTLKDLNKAGIKIDGFHVRALTLEKAHDRGYVQALIELNNVGAAVNSEVIGRLSIPMGQDPAYIKSLFSSMKGLNIDFPIRFLEDITEIINTRSNIGQKDSRPVALMIFPKVDWNHAYERNQMHELLKRGYRVIYFEVSNDSELINVVKKVGATQKISLLVIAGHGSQTRTNFGGPDELLLNVYGVNEAFYLDAGDGQKLNGLSNNMEKGSVIILESCSTGQGGEGEDNVANLIKKAFPYSRIFAPMEPSGVKNYQYDENNRVIGVDYVCGEEKTYSIK